MVVTRYDGYPDPAPRAARIEVRIIPATPTRLNALHVGEIGWAFVNLDSAAEIAEVRSNPAFRVTQVRTSSVFGLHLDIRVTP